MPDNIRQIAGCMTGTSIDAIDVALVKVTGTRLEMSAEIVDTLSLPLGDLHQPLKAFATGEPMPAGEIANLSQQFTELHVQALQPLAEKHRIDQIVVHGQTVYHQPPLSWQMISPHLVAARLGAPLLFDLRSADLAHGGEGAPITPLSDFIIFRSDHETRAIVNLGGFCNYTLLPRKGKTADIIGGDVCVCNQLLNKLSADLLQQPFDSNGQIAGRGTVNEELGKLLTDRLKSQLQASKSLGTGDEMLDLVEAYYTRLTPADILRSACHAIGAMVANCVGSADRVILAGGGCFNDTLVAEIREQCQQTVELSGDHGVPVSYREAAGMAVLGALTQDRVPITLPQVTGVQSAPIAGSWILP